MADVSAILFMPVAILGWIKQGVDERDALGWCPQGAGL